MKITLRPVTPVGLASCAFAIVMGLPLSGAHAQDQDVAEVVGTMDASGNGALPKGAVFAVRALSGGPDAKAIADLFRDALEDAGFRLRGGGGYELQFRVSGVSPQGRSGSSLNLSGDGGSGPSGTVDLKMRWKAETDKAAAPRRSRQISVLVTDADRNEVWRAHIRLQSASGGDLTLAHAMVPALIAHLGRTVFALRVP